MQRKSILLKSNRTINSTIKLNKLIILNKKINILTSSKLINNFDINNSNYINIDIISSPIIINNEKEKEYVIAFTDNDYLKLLKEYVNHPYFISNIKISNLKYYLDQNNSNLLIMYNGKEKFNKGLTIHIDDLNNLDYNMNMVEHNFIFK